MEKVFIKTIDDDNNNLIAAISGNCNHHGKIEMRYEKDDRTMTCPVCGEAANIAFVSISSTKRRIIDFIIKLFSEIGNKTELYVNDKSKVYVKCKHCGIHEADNLSVCEECGDELVINEIVICDDASKPFYKTF